MASKFRLQLMAKTMIDKTITLYHGTTPESAEFLVQNGWQPNRFATGSQCGQSRYLYLTTHPDDALWFANEKGSDTVLELKDIPYSMLKVDPEDGIGETIEEEIGSPHGLPGKLVLTQTVEASFFELYERPQPSFP